MSSKLETMAGRVEWAKAFPSRLAAWETETKKSRMMFSDASKVSLGLIGRYVTGEVIPDLQNMNKMEAVFVDSSL